MWNKLQNVHGKIINKKNTVLCQTESKVKWHEVERYTAVHMQQLAP